ncbi:hypothetical protein JCM14076_24390 [Methylosoma difficile]
MVRQEILKLYSLIFLSLFECSCAPASVQDRLNYLESVVYANDHKLSEDLKKLNSLYSENRNYSYAVGQDLKKVKSVITEYKNHLDTIESKTNKFCVYVSDDRQTLEILPEGECSKLE